MIRLTVLSYGCGQDSWVILQKLAYDMEFRNHYVHDQLIIIMADTGDEHPQTYEHLEYTREFCEKHGMIFIFITNDMGYHSKAWPSLRERYRMSNCVGSKAFPKTCTDNLKIKVIYRYLEHFLALNYNVPYGRKKGIKEFAERYGKIRVMIGFTRGEEGRVAKNDGAPVWMQKAIERSYPLIDIGYDRADCQKYTRDCNQPVPIPSNCMLCPWMNKAELLWLHRFYPDDYDDWVRLEQNKIDDNLHMADRNLGVWGKKLLPEILTEAEEEFGHWTNEELMDYKMSHGHCVKSKY